MFAYISGTAVFKTENYIIVDVHGIGFKIYSSLTCLNSITLNQTVKLHIYTSIREDAFDLVGFTNSGELSLFELLISVSGIGIKAGLSILSVATPDAVALAITGGDYKLITRAQGVGTKIAQRVVLELKDKLAKQYGAPADQPVSAEFAYDDCLAALMALGYSSNDARRAISACDWQGDDSQTIKQALKILSSG